MTKKLNLFFNLTVKFCAILLLGNMFVATALADNVRLLNKPLIESGVSDVLPNLMYILDNSGSMGWDYTPDWAGVNGEYLFRDSSFNTQRYNPEISYKPAVKYDGTSMPSQTAWTAVNNNAFNAADGQSNLVGNANYYLTVAGEYCTTPQLTSCVTQTAPNTTHPYPAPIRWCNSTAAATAATVTAVPPSADSCQSVRVGNYTTLRHPTSTTTIIFSGNSNTTIDGITVAGFQIMSGASNTSASSNTIASSVRNRINACANTLTGNCQLSGFIASASGSTVTINSPYGDAAVSLTPVVSATGSMTANANAFTRITPGKMEYVKIEAANNSYPLPGQATKYFERTDCAGTTCTYSEEMTNFANWYTYYRTRIQGMKTSTSIAFKSIDSRFRVGFITINNPGGNFIPNAKFDGGVGQQKDNWYARLFSVVPANATPLRSALSLVGRYYANKVGVTDPVEYACQPNYALLTTDGYWNGDGGLDVNGNSVGNLDGDSTPRPMFEGPTASSNSLADVAKYYYDTDLRTTALGNCDGVVGQKVCGEEVGSESFAKQNMTTLTLGLGIDGTLTYSSDYKTQTVGDFANIKAGTANWPVPSENTPSAIDDLWHAAVNGNGTYFSASNPKEVSDSLKRALADVKANVGAGTAAATSSLQPSAGDNTNYVAGYTTAKWIGNLEARAVDANTLEVSPTATWCAEDVPPCRGTMAAKVSANSDSRTIFFNSGGTLTNFTYANLPTAQKAFFEANYLSTRLSQWSGFTSDAGGQQSKAVGNGLVNFIRGQKGLEDRGSNSAIDRIFRLREAVLGDITESQAAYVKKPRFNYTDPNYNTFKTNNAGRQGMVYVGANDGMLHAFNADNGDELWAFIPTPVIRNLWRLADKDYAANHQNYVNGDISVYDICSGGCGTNSATWRTILVGGLSGGGRGYYAIDITNPSSPSLLWEYTAQNDSNLGYTYAKADVTKLQDGTWVVLITTGQNNGSKDNDGITSNSPVGDGVGRLIVLNAQSGAVIRTISTGAGDASTPSGLAQAAAFVEDGRKNNVAGYVYAGDLLGNLWRFDINDGAALKIANLTGASNQPQPITTAPELGQINDKRIIFVATGKYLELADLTNTQAQSLYAIKDDDLTATLGAVRSTLIKQTINQSGDTRTASSQAVNFSSGLGWYVDFPDTGERANLNPTLVDGVLLVATIVPQSTSCKPGGYGWFNYFDYKSGAALPLASNLVSQKLKSPAAGYSVQYDQNGVAKVSVTEVTNATPKLINGIPFPPSGGDRSTIFEKVGAGSNKDTYGRKYNWRELVPNSGQ